MGNRSEWWRGTSYTGSDWAKTATSGTIANWLVPDSKGSDKANYEEAESSQTRKITASRNTRVVRSPAGTGPPGDDRGERGSLGDFRALSVAADGDGAAHRAYLDTRASNSQSYTGASSYYD